METDGEFSLRMGLAVPGCERPRSVVQRSPEIVDGVRDEIADLTGDWPQPMSAKLIAHAVWLRLYPNVVQRTPGQQIQGVSLYLLDLLPRPAQTSVDFIQWPAHQCSMPLARPSNDRGFKLSHQVPLCLDIGAGEVHDPAGRRRGQPSPFPIWGRRRDRNDDEETGSSGLDAYR